MLELIAKKSTSILFVVLLVLFIAFSKGVLTPVQFIGVVGVLVVAQLMLKFAVSGSSPVKSVKSEWKSGFLGQVRVGSGVLLVLAIGVQFVAGFTDVLPVNIVLGTLGVAVASVIVWMMLGLVQEYGELPSIITYVDEDGNPK